MKMIKMFMIGLVGIVLMSSCGKDDGLDFYWKSGNIKGIVRSNNGNTVIIDGMIYLNEVTKKYGKNIIAHPETNIYVGSDYTTSKDKIMYRIEYDDFDNCYIFLTGYFDLRYHSIDFNPKDVVFTVGISNHSGK